MHANMQAWQLTPSMCMVRYNTNLAPFLLLLQFLIVLQCVYCKAIQWNLSITDTFGDQHFVRYSKVSPTQGLPVYFR